MRLGPRTHVLLSGGAGFIGARLGAALLGSGARVTIVTRDVGRESARRLQGLGARLVAADLARDDAERDLDAIGATDVVCHLAADVSVSGPGLEATNVAGTRRMIELAGRLGASYFVHASSIEAQGPGSPGETPLAESAPARPITPYGASKLAAEAIAGERAAGGGATAIVRIGNVYGPGSPWLVRPALLALAGATPLSPIYAAIAGRRLQPIHVDDLVRALVRIIEARPCGLFNATGEEVLTLAGLFRTLAGLVGFEEELDAIERAASEPPPARVSVDPDFAYFLLGDGARPDRVYDDARLRAEIGSYAHRRLERGLAASVAWLYSSGALAPLVAPPPAERGEPACTPL